MFTFNLLINKYTRLFYVLFKSAHVHLTQTLSRSTFKFVIFFQPLIYSFLLYMMYRDSVNINIGEKIFLGSGLLTLWTSIIFSSAGDINRERYMGTMEIIYSSPTDFRVIYLGKILANLILGLFSVILSFICTKYFFQLDITLKSPVYFILAVIVTIFSFVTISILFAMVFTLSRNSNLLMNCLEYPIFILCGFTFPISLLPEKLQYISYILSPTWTVLVLREGLVGVKEPSNFFLHISYILFLSIFYLILSSFLYKKVDQYARKNGTLGVF